MRRTAAIVMVVAATFASGGMANAAGNDQSGPTVGDCISDGFYGNEPNMANGAPGGPAEQEPGANAGNVIPSQSPGPKRTLPDGSVIAGNSIGDYQRGAAVPGVKVSIPKLCQTAVQQ